jgi:hypothetical protein
MESPGCFPGGAWVFTGVFGRTCDTELDFVLGKPVSNLVANDGAEVSVNLLFLIAVADLYNVAMIG